MLVNLYQVALRKKEHILLVTDFQRKSLEVNVALSCQTLQSHWATVVILLVFVKLPLPHCLLHQSFTGVKSDSEKRFCVKCNTIYKTVSILIFVG